MHALWMLRRALPSCVDCQDAAAQGLKPDTNMGAPERIRKLGFRRWYERQLIESHAYFVTCFACMILVVATLEAAHSDAASGYTLLLMSLAVLGVAGAVAAWRRYRKILLQAESIAESASCKACRAYGAFAVTAHGRDSTDGPPHSTGYWLCVRCRRCQHEWRIG